jgi:hypothetical protein
VLPDLDLVAVFNSKHPESDGVFNGQWVLGKYILPAILPPPGLHQVVERDSDSVAEYQGEYVNDQWPETLVVRQRENRIVLFGADGESAPFVVDSPDVFYFDSGDLGELQIIFTRDGTGTVTGLVGRVGFFGLQFDKVM